MNNYIEKLEFKNILNSISTYCTFFLSKKMSLNINPSKNFDEIKIKYVLYRACKSDSLIDR